MSQAEYQALLPHLVVFDLVYIMFMIISFGTRDMAFTRIVSILVFFFNICYTFKI
jgi:hypothetical protein